MLDNREMAMKLLLSVIMVVSFTSFLGAMEQVYSSEYLKVPTSVLSTLYENNQLLGESLDGIACSVCEQNLGDGGVQVAKLSCSHIICLACFTINDGHQCSECGKTYPQLEFFLDDGPPGVSKIYIPTGPNKPDIVVYILQPDHED